MEPEEYLRNVKLLLSQMNDMEAEAAKRSMEEQRQRAFISSVREDLHSVRSELKLLNEETEKLMKSRTRVCREISDKQKKMTFLEKESSTLSQTLELLHQEICSSSEKVKKKRSYYKDVLDKFSAELKDQQDWFHLNKQKAPIKIQFVKGNPTKSSDSIEGNMCNKIDIPQENLDILGNEATLTRCKDSLARLAAEEAKLEELKKLKSEHDLKGEDLKLQIEQANHMLKDIPPELQEMDVKALEEEHKALLDDKVGETEYLQTLQDQIKQLKEISEFVDCQCGERYKVELLS